MAPSLPASIYSRLRRSMSYNIQTFRANPLGEISGSLGDLGTLLPLMTALANAKSIDFSSTLIFTGIFNIATGIYFGVPIAVQPMKAVASMALASGMDKQTTMGAGLAVGLTVTILAITGLLEKAGSIIPIPIIKGIQIGAGLSLILNAGAKVPKFTCTHWQYCWALDYYGLHSLFWAILATLLVFATSRSNRFPYALSIFVIGLFWSFQLLPSLGLQLPQLDIPTMMNISRGFWVAGAGQLPLTVLNSIIAVTQLSRDLLPSRSPPSLIALGLSIGAMNMIGCCFGSMPVCHGSGGLAGQYRCGARSGASMIFLGIVKLSVGLLVGHGLLDWLSRFSGGLLAVLIFLAGLELVGVGSSLNTTAPDLRHNSLTADESSSLLPHSSLSNKSAEERWITMTITAGTVIMFKNSFVGFIAGYTYWALLQAQEMWPALSRL